MIEEINKAIAKDKILKFLIDISPKDTDYREIKHSVLSNYDSEIIISLIEELIESDNIIIHKSIGNTNIISANSTTKIFLNNGGYKEVEIKKQDLITQQQTKDDIEFKKLKDDAHLSRLKVKTFWPLFGLALFGGLYSLQDFIHKIFTFFSK